MKTCRYCNQTKDLNEFSVRENGRLNSKCKSCVRVYSKAHYESNRKVHIQRRNENAKVSRKMKRDLLNEAKAVPCFDCGQSYPPWVMDFDHLGDKLFNVSTMVNSRTIEEIRTEVMKCEVVCANCHRQRTYGRSLRS